jgi:hypothetical protein
MSNKHVKDTSNILQELARDFDELSGLIVSNVVNPAVASHILDLFAEITVKVVELVEGGHCVKGLREQMGKK